MRFDNKHYENGITKYFKLNRGTNRILPIVYFVGISFKPLRSTICAVKLSAKYKVLSSFTVKLPKKKTLRVGNNFRLSDDVQQFVHDPNLFTSVIERKYYIF